MEGSQQISSNISQHQGALSQMQIEAFVGKTVARNTWILDGKAENEAVDFGIIYHLVKKYFLQNML